MPKGRLASDSDGKRRDPILDFIMRNKFPAISRMGAGLQTQQQVDQMLNTPDRLKGMVSANLGMVGDLSDMFMEGAAGSYATEQGMPIDTVSFDNPFTSRNIGGVLGADVDGLPFKSGEFLDIFPDPITGVKAAALGLGVLGTGMAYANRGTKASPIPVNKQRGSFGGVNSKTADLDQQKVAETMEAAGKNRDEIYDATGWWRGAGEEWKYEIDDSFAKLRIQGWDTPEGRDKLANFHHDMDYDKLAPDAQKKIAALAEDSARRNFPIMGTAEELFQHDELYDAYPELRNGDMSIMIDPSLNNTIGGFDPWNNSVSVEAYDAETARSIALHELGGHGVQKKANHPAGTSVEGIIDSRQQGEDELGRIGFHLQHAKRNQPHADDTTDYANWKRENLEKLQSEYDRTEKYYYLTDDYDRDVFTMYDETAGEVDARNIETRRDWTNRERRATRPWESQDTPTNQQIVRYDNRVLDEDGLPIQKGVQRKEGVLSDVGKLKEEAVGKLDREANFDPRILEQDRLDNLSVGINQSGDEIPTTSIFDYEGSPFVSAYSDRTRAGGVLESINDVKLDNPVELHGGQDFMFNNPYELAWASNKSPASGIRNKADKMRRQTGQDPLWLPWRMQPTGGDFASTAGESMLAYASSNMSKTGRDSVDAMMRKYMRQNKAGAWKGIRNPESIEQFRNLPDAVRKDIKNELDVRFRNEGGLSIGEARLAVGDPYQYNRGVGKLQNVGRIHEGGNPSVTGHPWYSHGVRGEGIGRLAEDDLSIFELTPIHRYGGKTVADPRNPTPNNLYSAGKQALGGVITEDILREIEKRRK